MTSFEQLEPFSVQLHTQHGQSRQIAPGTGQALDQARLHRVTPHAYHHNGERRRRLLSGARRLKGVCHDQVDLETHQLSRQLWELLQLALREAIGESDGLSLHVAQLPQALPEDREVAGGVRQHHGGVGCEDADQRDRAALLRRARE
jgi:hypothetical protein